MSRFSVETIFKAIDRMSGPMRAMSKGAAGALSKVDASTKQLNTSVNAVNGGLMKAGRLALAAAVPVVGLGTAAVTTAAEFEREMSNVSTLIDTNTESLDDMGKAVLDIGNRTPVAVSELTTALYDVRSAGVDASDQFTVLEKSAQLGVAGLGTTQEAVDLVTSSLNAFNLKGEEADAVYDQIFKTVKSGKTTISALSQGFGATAGTIAASGTNLDEYLSSVAALTTTGQPAAQAHTQLKAVVAGLTRETAESSKVFGALGAKDLPTLIKASGGLVPALQRISDHYQGNNADILKLVGSTEALNAVIGLTGNQAEAQRKTLDSMRNGANAVDEAFRKQAATAAAVSQTIKNKLKSLAVSVGGELLPELKSVAGAFGEWVTANKAVITSGIKEFIAGFKEALPEIITWLTRIGKVLLVFYTFAAAVKVATAAMAIFNAITAANPLTLWAIGIVAAIALIWAFWPEITAFFTMVWEKIKSIATAIGNFLKPAFQFLVGAILLFLSPLMFYVQKLVAFWKMVFGALAPYLSALWEGIKTVFFAVWDGLGTFLSEKIEFWKTLFSPLVEFFSGIWSAIGDAFMATWGWIFEKIQGAVSFVQGIGSAFMGGDESPETSGPADRGAQKMLDGQSGKVTGEIAVKGPPGTTAKAGPKSPVGLRVAATGAG